MIRGFARKFFEGKSCINCGKYSLYKLKDKRLKCKNCKTKYSLKKLKRDLEILYYFYLEISARRAANELGLNYKTVQSRFMSFRKSINEYSKQEISKLNGELELDETYFGGRRKGKRGRGANNKAIAFGILERNGKIHTIIVENVKEDTLMEAIKNKTKKGSVFYTDGFKSYASLHQYGKHNIIKHNEDEFAKGRTHINGIEGFWSYAKERFHKYHGINRKNYPLYLKEMEFRFNHRNKNVFKLLIDICIKRRRD